MNVDMSDRPLVFFLSLMRHPSTCSAVEGKAIMGFEAVQLTFGSLIRMGFLFEMRRWFGTLETCDGSIR